MIELKVLDTSAIPLDVVGSDAVELEVTMSTGGAVIHNQDKSVTPTESTQSITADTGYTGLGTVTVGAISSDYVGSNVPRIGSNDILVYLDAMQMPSGYYPRQLVKTVENTTLPTTMDSAKGNHYNKVAEINPSTDTRYLNIPKGFVLSDYGKYYQINPSVIPSGTKSITANGTGIDVTNYASADVNVPNTYSASDEGKVVSSGALVSQTSDTVTANDTYDTTLINSLTVNVSGGDPYEVIDKLMGRNFTGTFSSNYSGVCKKDSVLANQAGLTAINMPNVTQLGNSSTITGSNFARYCTSLTSVSMPQLQKMYGSYYFGGCTALLYLVLPSLIYTYGQHAFDGITNLKRFEVGKSTTTSTSNFDQYHFTGCNNLEMIVIRHTNVVAVNNINAFNNTPFKSGGTGGTLYVPNSLISSYQASTNWATILGYTNNQIKSIESTHTDPDAPIDLTLYHVDGTPL